MSTMSHILYVEDERPVIELVRASLEMAGYRVKSAMSGNEAISLMKANKPELVLLDLMMPEVNGWDVYRMMKTDQTLNDIPVIVVTSKIPDEDEHIIIQGLPPVEDYITKPFDVGRLTRAIQSVLAKQT